jgi:amidase
MTSLRALAARLRTRDLGAVELLEATLAEIERRDADVNAFAHVLADRALAAARSADAQRGPLPPLHGMPFSVKEQIHVAGVQSRDASLLLEPVVPSMDAQAVARLRQAGAIVVGTTNMSELALFPDSVNRVYGATRNPHDLGRSAGGSSGGEAAAVAARLVVFGIGSDYGGSIRCPAHFCGVAGLRPGPGLMPGGGAEGRLRATARSTLSSVGPLARTIDDIGVVLDALDASPRPAPFRRFSLLVADRDALDGACADALDRVAEALVGLGLGLVDGDGPPADAGALFDELTAIETHGMLRALVPGREAEASAQLLAVWESVAEPRPGAHAEALARLPSLQEAVQEWLGHDRVLVAPAASSPAFELGRLDGVFDLFVDCKLASVAGLPALVVPVPGDGVPVGVQLIGPRGSEHLLVDIGRHVDTTLGAVTYM